MKENDMEDMFKEKFEDFEPEVDSKVWRNVKGGIKVAGVGALGKFLISKLGTNALIAVVSSVITVIGTVTFMNFGEEEKLPIANNPNVVVEQPKQLTPEEIIKFLKTEVGDEAVKTESEKVVSNTIKNENSVKIIKAKSIANIQASSTSGVAPLIVDVSNSGKGKKNTWMLGDKKNNNESPAYFFDVPGNYVIKLLSINAEGQSQMDSIKVEVLPNSEVELAEISFTPNGDGKKDYFSVAAKHIVQLEAEILDKEGRLVYKWTGIDGKWDGQNIKHEEAKAGTYYYILKSVDAAGNKAENKGTVKLIR